jgi:hypothetical protein
MIAPGCDECGTRMAYHHSEKWNSGGTAVLEIYYECSKCRPDKSEEKGVA